MYQNLNILKGQGTQKHSAVAFQRIGELDPRRLDLTYQAHKNELKVVYVIFLTD